MKCSRHIYVSRTTHYSFTHITFRSCFRDLLTHLWLILANQFWKYTFLVVTDPQFHFGENSTVLVNFSTFLPSRTQMQPCFQPSAIRPLLSMTTPCTVRRWTRSFASCGANMASSGSSGTATAQPTKTRTGATTNLPKWRWVLLEHRGGRVHHSIVQNETFWYHSNVQIHNDIL